MLALFTADAIPGLAIGCAIANLANLSLSGLGSFSALDLAYSVLMAIAGSLFAWRFRKHPYIVAAGLLAINAIIVFLIHAHFGTLGVLDAVFGFIASAFAAAFIYRAELLARNTMPRKGRSASVSFPYCSGPSLTMALSNL